MEISPSQTGRVGPMRIWITGALAFSLLLAASTTAAAQTRPRVSGSETSRGTGPTCVVNGDAGACGESSTGGMMTVLPGPVILGASPIIGPLLGGDSSGRASTDTDVSRSTRNGNALAR